MSTEKDKSLIIFAERLKSAIPDDMTQQEFANSIGVGLSTLRKWLSGSSLPTFEYISVIAKGLGKTTDWVLTGELDIPHKNDKTLSFLNIYDAELSAGAGTYIEGSNIIARYALPDIFFSAYNINKAKALGVSVRGDSMEPKFHNGDIVVVDCSEKRVQSDGIYAFYYEGNCFIKHLQLIGGELYAISSNKAYEKWAIDAQSDFKIIGMVKAAVSRI